MSTLFADNTHLWCSNITQLKSEVRGTWNLHILNLNSTMCMVQRDEFWFKFQETILFEHIGDVEQVRFEHIGDVEQVRFEHIGDVEHVRFEHIGDVEQVRLIMLGQVDSKYMQQLV